MTSEGKSQLGYQLSSKVRKKKRACSTSVYRLQAQVLCNIYEVPINETYVLCVETSHCKSPQVVFHYILYFVLARQR